MKLISDIRLYRSRIPNIDGNSIFEDDICRQTCLMAQRVTMKLREKEFSLGEFTHLYVNFTTCLSAGEIRAAARSVDPYHPWYRYYDVGVNEAEYEMLADESGEKFASEQICRVLTECFASNLETMHQIREAVSEAAEQGENMLMRFKEKKSAKAKAVLFLRLLDSGEYQPLLCVYDMQGKERLRKELAPGRDFLPLGEILLSSKRVAVRPRKNALTKMLNLKEVVFELENEWFNK